MGNDNVKDYPPYLDYPKPRKPQAKVTEELDGWWEAFKALADMVKSDSVKDLAVKSNADRIRAMTEDELAQFFGNMVDCDTCPLDGKMGTCPLGCEATWGRWLKQEAQCTSE